MWRKEVLRKSNPCRPINCYSPEQLSDEFAPSLEPIFCMQDCHCQIPRVEYKGQTRSSSQCRSLHGLQVSHFICDLFGRKLWLQSIQNHYRHHFLAFAFCHLKPVLTVLFHPNLSRRPFLGQIVDSELDLLLC